MIDRLVQLLIDGAKLFKFFCVVRAFEGGVILRLGRFHREVAPGFHWLWPFELEELVYTNVVDELIEIGPQSLTTADGVSIVLSTVVTFAVKDPRKFLLEVEGANQAVADAAVGAQARYVLGKTWRELLASDKPEELTAIVRKRGWRYGVEVRSVEVKDFTRSRSYRLLSSANRTIEGSWRA
jgi:regulator of protease activity HflC (stomatin/prohibitin superfamily)